MRARSRIVYFTGYIKAYNNVQACFSTGVAFSVAFGILYRLNYLNRHRSAHLCSLSPWRQQTFRPAPLTTKSQQCRN